MKSAVGRIPDIVAECRELVSRGVKEITFLGPDCHQLRQARHCRCATATRAFVQLLEAAHEIEGLERIRFTSPHPKGYGDDLVEAYGRLPKLVESAHIPVQSGSDRVLKTMHRGYTRERYLELVTKLRQVRPEIGLSTDFIVGFPGETEEDFEQTLVARARSPVRPGLYFQVYPSGAILLPPRCRTSPETVREERHQRLLRLVNEVAAKPI